MSDFVKKYAAKELFLTKNFRSYSKVVELANGSIARAEERMTHNRTGDSHVSYIEHQTEEDEIQWLVNYLRKLNTL